MAGAGLYLAAFTVLATLFFLVGTGLFGAFAHPFWQWWLYALWYSGNPVVRAWLEVSGVPAAILPLAVAASIWYRRRRVRGWTLRANPAPARPVAPPIRGTTDNYGHARWALMAEAQALWPGPNRSPGSGSGASPGSSSGAGFGGVVVGEAYDPRQARGPVQPAQSGDLGRGRAGAAAGRSLR